MTFERGRFIEIVDIELLSFQEDLTEGKQYEILAIDNDGDIVIMDDANETHHIQGSGFDGLKLVPTENERISTLEGEVAELKVIVEGLRKNKFNVEADAETVGQALAETLENVIEFEGAKYRKVEREAREGDVVIFKGNADSMHFDVNVPQKVTETSSFGPSISISDSGKVPVYNGGWYRTPETVDVYERIMPSTVEKVDVQHETLACSAATPKTANELRAEVIEKAKEFYEGMNGDYKYFVEESTGTVIVLDKINKTVNLTSSPSGEVFNEHIQKAITIGRVKGMDVSEFEQAVQPTLAIGQTVETFKEFEKDKETHLIGKVESFNDSYIHYTKQTYIENGFGGATRTSYGMKGYKILNDTNAIYGGVE